MTDRLRRPLSLRLQVPGSILAVPLPSMAVMFLYYPGEQERIARNLFRAQVETTTQAVSTMVMSALAKGDTAELREIVLREAENPALVYAMVLDPSGVAPPRQPRPGAKYRSES